VLICKTTTIYQFYVATTLEDRRYHDHNRSWHVVCRNILVNDVGKCQLTCARMKFSACVE